MNTDKVKRIEVIDDNGRQYHSNNPNNKLELSLQDDDTTLKVIIKQFESAEQKAEKLGFKIGDRCWVDTNNKNYKYWGIIDRFDFNVLCAYDKNDNQIILDKLTNKIAIHCPTKEDFEFIWNKLGKYAKLKTTYFKKEYIDLSIPSCIYINGMYNGWDKKTTCINNNYLILSVDEYCKAMNIKPLFITKDEKVIYNPKQIVYGIYGHGYSPFPAECLKHIDIVFSTEQLAKDYLESSKPNFKINKWYSYNDTKTIICYTGDDNFCFGFTDNIWFGLEKKYRMLDLDNWKLVDINDVKFRLIEEAKKRYPNGTIYKRAKHPKDTHFQISNGEFKATELGVYNNKQIGWLLYEGIWAEIVKGLEEVSKNTIEVEIPKNTTHTSNTTTEYDTKIVKELIFTKEPKLITEDGVKLYVGDKFLSWSEYTTISHYDQIMYSDFIPHKDYKYFSSKESMDKYMYNLHVERLKLLYNQ